jgi:hypothetical protein
VAKARFVSCPRCGAQVAWLTANRHRPFCSERCRLFDLGDWATGKYRVPVEEEKDAPESKEAD